MFEGGVFPRVPAGGAVGALGAPAGVAASVPAVSVEDAAGLLASLAAGGVLAGVVEGLLARLLVTVQDSDGEDSDADGAGADGAGSVGGGGLFGGEPGGDAAVVAAAEGLRVVGVEEAGSTGLLGLGACGLGELAAACLTGCAELSARPGQWGPGGQVSPVVGFEERRFNTICLLSARLGVSRARAGQIIDHGSALMNIGFNPTEVMERCGVLDSVKASLVTRRLEDVPVPVALAVQDQVLSQAPRGAVSQVGRDIERALIEVDPDGHTEHTRATVSRRCVSRPRPVGEGLCQAHHRLKHTPGWAPTKDQTSGDLSWHTPDKTAYQRHPDGTITRLPLKIGPHQHLVPSTLVPTDLSKQTTPKIIDHLNTALNHTHPSSGSTRLVTRGPHPRERPGDYETTPPPKNHPHPRTSPPHQPHPTLLKHQVPRTVMTSRRRYAELHAHSAYSFLDGANEPDELASAAVELGVEALALTDHDGVPGIVKHAQAGRAHGLPTIHGTELTLADGSHLPVLARSPIGYRRLVSAISQHNLDAGARREPAHDLPTLAAALRSAPTNQTGGSAGTCLILTGTANGPLRRALGDPRRPSTWDLKAADAYLGHLADLFAAPDRGRPLGAGSTTNCPQVEGDAAVGLAVELTLDGGPTDAALTDVLTRLAHDHRLPLVATGAVRCARPADARLADVLTSTRLVTDLEGARGHLPAIGRWLRGAQDMARLHRRRPDAVDLAADLASDLAFDLSLIAPDLPDADVPEGHTPATWLRELTRQGATRRYGTPQEHPRAWEVLNHELEVIESLGFPGYFLIVHSIVEFCRQSGILCQGRGSAANSAVCYALGITAVDAVRHQMLFERFLSPGRAGYPDIDLDIEACRREEVIQHVYSRYGRDCAAQVANVISYRPRSAVRDAARALGHPAGVQDTWARQMDRWATVRLGGLTGQGDEVPEPVLDIAEKLLRLPRHLGVHPGGMVLCDRPVTEVCPVRWAAMDNRSVLQWDKDDCSEAGLVKFDLLGLGALTALRLAFTTLAERGQVVPDVVEEGELRSTQTGRPWGLHTLPEEDPAVYRLLTAADTVGVFQVESRAQMATLPRLRPKTFYDIVVEVALIRPGPIQGDAVNPYIRRRLKREEVTYLHDSLKPALAKTLGVPLFQEQLMQIAVDAAGFSPAEADTLRQAMGAKRSLERMDALHDRLVAGMRARDIDEATAEEIYSKLRSFAEFGFPESHAFSFAYLVYASAWLKVRKPEDFYAGVLAAQPMGFWSPQSLVADARRHGVRVLPADVNHSLAQATVERRRAQWGTGPSPERAEQWRPLTPHSAVPSPLDVHDDLAVRLGLSPIKGLGERVAQAIVTERRAHGPYLDQADLARRVNLSCSRLEALAASGALDSLGTDRRRALWAAGILSDEHGRRRGASRQDSGGWFQPTLPGTAVGAVAPTLPTMTDRERQAADLNLTGVSTQGSPLRSLRPGLTADGVLRAADLSDQEHGSRVRVAGVVTHRQRPHTATGMIFLNLEDETGLLNVVCRAGMWRRYRSVGRRAGALIVRGTVEKGDGVVALMAEHLQALPGVPSTGSRDWC